jgi:solute carrier family 6 GABA transporter-like protein 1
MGFNIKRVVGALAPDAEKEDDGRDKWPSRAAFVLAAMGGAVGLGNLLRYPSVVFANNGLQWFIPYLIALFFLGIPVLCLEICIGQAYRGSVVVAFNGINKRTKGVGLAVIMNSFIVATYYVPILAWIMHYFRCSFESPLPWTGRGQEFYMNDVIANVDPVAPEGSGYVDYPGRGFVGETVG